MTNKELYETLSYKPKNIFEVSDEQIKKSAFDFCEGYKDFLKFAKTERLAVVKAIEIAENAGFKPLDAFNSLKAGDKVYVVNRKKGIMLAVIGSGDIKKDGINIIGAHMDVPRLDLKPRPIYESNGMVLLKTHYYGGIKKYQWPALPLTLYGIIHTADGNVVEISIGDNPGDPVFVVTDLLPHLSSKQMDKPMKEGITGEELNIVAGSVSINDKEIDEKIKFNILKLLNEKYGIVEKDFLSAEIEAVPAIDPRDVGLDSGIIGSYGQDDRVCSYTALKAICDITIPKKTAVCLLVDKEEIGSEGNTGMQSRFFESALTTLTKKLTDSCSWEDINTIHGASSCLSADVTAAYDPTFESVMDSKNSAYLGSGIVIAKYVGARGKSGSNDASAEFNYKICSKFDNSGVIWQTGELGKVDAGGGGTISGFLANLNIDVIDCGVALLSMHSPFELASKADIYMAYKAYKSFFE